jgi:hypothetical protein
MGRNSRRRQTAEDYDSGVTAGHRAAIFTRAAMKSAARLKERLSTPLERIRTYDASTPGGSVRAWLSPAAPTARASS